ncbi:MAG: hypothetical protein IKN04_23225 [Clostridia bacterium]|nr:hypothetical protein [Clostridia bacterium]
MMFIAFPPYEIKTIRYFLAANRFVNLAAMGAVSMAAESSFPFYRPLLPNVRAIVQRTSCFQKNKCSSCLQKDKSSAPFYILYHDLRLPSPNYQKEMLLFFVFSE